MKTRPLVILALLIPLLLLSPTVRAENQEGPTNVEIGCWLISVERLDLASSTYRLDFYLWFRFDPAQISPDEVKAFEFVNGAPARDLISQSDGYIEYRVRGDFVKTFNFAGYPFEVHDLRVELEHKYLNASYLRFTVNPSSNIDETANVAGWNIGSFETSVTEHSYAGDDFSRFVFSISLGRPMLSSFIKSVLPISVITTISLLAFFISPQNFGQRIGIGVTTLLSATAFHLSLLSGIPPTGYLTFADRMMICIYVIFLYNLSVSVLIMKLVDKKKPEEAESLNRRALKILPLMIGAMIIILIISQFFI